MHGEIVSMLDTLRRTGGPPLHFAEPFGLWIVTGREEARAVLRDSATYSSAAMRPADDVLLGADPPGHSANRAIVNAAFARHERALAERAEAYVDELIPELMQRDGFDVICDLAEPLMCRVTADLLGHGAEHRSSIGSWSRAQVEHGIGGPQSAEAREALRTMDRALRARVAAAADEREPTFVGDLLRAGLSSDQARSVARLLVSAGTETTVSLIGNVTARRLAAAFRDEDSKTTVEESLRADCPVQYVLRITTADTTLDGRSMKAGSLVLVSLAAANLDSRLADAGEPPHAGREAAGTLAFGHGPHYCLGAGLARTIAHTVLRRLSAADFFQRARLRRDVEVRIQGQLRTTASLAVDLEPAA